jgi:hypothetical protein
MIALLEHFKYSGCQIGALVLKASLLISHGSFKCSGWQIGALVLKPPYWLVMEVSNVMLVKLEHLY